MTADFSPERSLLRVEGLSVKFDTPAGLVRAADEVSFDLHSEETLALVGETGCGKSVVASAIMRLLPKNALVSGRIAFCGGDLLALSEREMSDIRGRDLAIVFQNPSLSLNPIIRVAEQVAEPLQVHGSIHGRMSRMRFLSAAEDMLARLGLREKGLGQMYPFQFSGGMNQRAMIATSMMLSPKVLIADEPSKGLDSELALEVMQEMRGIKDQLGSSLLLITHDLTLARRFSDRMAVMYCGQILEMGECEQIFTDPLHPYTQALLRCLPENGFHPIPGSSPSMIEPPDGCRFQPRCSHCQEICKSRRPDMVSSHNREVRCWLF